MNHNHKLKEKDAVAKNLAAKLSNLEKKMSKILNIIDEIKENMDELFQKETKIRSHDAALHFLKAKAAEKGVECG